MIRVGVSVCVGVFCMCVVVGDRICVLVCGSLNVHSHIHSLHKWFKINNQALSRQWKRSCKQSNPHPCPHTAYILKEGQRLNNEINTF